MRITHCVIIIATDEYTQLAGETEQDGPAKLLICRGDGTVIASFLDNGRFESSASLRETGLAMYRIAKHFRKSATGWEQDFVVKIALPTHQLTIDDDLWLEWSGEQSEDFNRVRDYVHKFVELEVMA